MKLLEKFLKDPYDFIENCTLSQLVKLIKDANKQYYNYGNPIMTDEEYDILKDELEKRDPNNKLLTQVGDILPEHTKNKIKLPYHMGSM